MITLPQTIMKTFDDLRFVPYSRLMKDVLQSKVNLTNKDTVLVLWYQDAIPPRETVYRLMMYEKHSYGLIYQYYINCHTKEEVSAIMIDIQENYQNNDEN